MAVRALLPLKILAIRLRQLLKLESELELIRLETGTVWANILNVLFKSRREWLDSTIETINSYAKYIELAEARTGQERCLKCSSYVVFPTSLPRKGEI